MDHPTAAASAASTALAATWAAGVPPDGVVLAALAGAVLSVWNDAPAVITPRWLAAALGRFGAALGLGLGGAAAVPLVAAGYAWLAPLALAPQWVLAGLLAYLARPLELIARAQLARWVPPAAGTVDTTRS